MILVLIVLGTVITGVVVFGIIDNWRWRDRLPSYAARRIEEISGRPVNRAFAYKVGGNLCVETHFRTGAVDKVLVPPVGTDGERKLIHEHYLLVRKLG